MDDRAGINFRDALEDAVAEFLSFRIGHIAFRRIFLSVAGGISCGTAWEEGGCAFGGVCDRLTTWPEG